MLSRTSSEKLSCSKLRERELFCAPKNPYVLGNRYNSSCAGRNDSRVRETPQTDLKKDTTNKTFRLDRSEFDILAREAKERNVSPNEIVSELIAEDLDREHYLRALKTIRVSSLMLKLITEVISDEKIIE